VGRGFACSLVFALQSIRDRRFYVKSVMVLKNCMPILFISNINSWPTHAERLCVRVHAGVRAQERLDHSRLL
jgi:hypothetical protein